MVSKFSVSTVTWSKCYPRRGKRRGNAVHSLPGWYKVSYLPQVLSSRWLTMGFRTESELRRYLRYFHLPDATEEEIDRLLEFYPDGASPRWVCANISSQCRCRSCAGVPLRNWRSQPTHASMEATVFNPGGPSVPMSTPRVLEESLLETRYVVIL